MPNRKIKKYTVIKYYTFSHFREMGIVLYSNRVIEILWVDGDVERGPRDIMDLKVDIITDIFA